MKQAELDHRASYRKAKVLHKHIRDSEIERGSARNSLRVLVSIFRHESTPSLPFPRRNHAEVNGASLCGTCKRDPG